MDLLNRLQSAFADLPAGLLAVGLELKETAVDTRELTVEYEDGIRNTWQLEGDGIAETLLAWLQSQTGTESYDDYEAETEDAMAGPAPAEQPSSPSL